MTKEFCLSDRENTDGDGDYNQKDVKEFIKRLKKRIDILHDEQKGRQETTRLIEVAKERLNKANLIYGNGGILEEIDKLAGDKLVEDKAKT